MESVPVKTCKKCGEVKPLESFSPMKGCKDGRRPDCKLCRSAQSGRYYAANRERVSEQAKKHRLENPEKMRQRRREEYRREPEKAKARCKGWREANPERKRETDRLWEERNPDKKKASAKRYRTKNRRATNARSAAWRAANQPRMCELGRLWREANPEKAREQTRRWRRENPERAALQRRVRYSRLTSANGSYTTQDLADKLELQGGLCYYCDEELPEKGFDLDHKIPLSKGGSNWPANVCLSCRSCNRRKNDKDFWGFSGKRRRQPYF